MTNLRIMPDLPDELVRYNNDNMYQIIFKETYFIKKLFADECNIEALSSICNLDIDGFNSHKRIFIDESGRYIFLVAKYLDEYEYKDTYETILNMSLEEILTLFKIMLERLKPAHQEDFNPYDLEYGNYLLDKDNKPVFTDFDCSFCKGECTYKSPYEHFEPRFDFEKQSSLRDSLVINDKMKILKLFLQSISSSFELEEFSKRGIVNLYEYLAYFYKNLQEKFILPQEIDEYLKDIIINKMLPKEDDYFIKNLINPLEKGLELKL